MGETRRKFDADFREGARPQLSADLGANYCEKSQLPAAAADPVGQFAQRVRVADLLGSGWGSQRPS
jgi:hypothetical protein